LLIAQDELENLHKEDEARNKLAVFLLKEGVMLTKTKPKKRCDSGPVPKTAKLFFSPIRGSVPATPLSHKEQREYFNYFNTKQQFKKENLVSPTQQFSLPNKPT